jgi:Carboxypeptidase regulatory-like domain/TonB dependent receptor/TonB-dependent Receptor Plug Domain
MKRMSITYKLLVAFVLTLATCMTGWAQSNGSLVGNVTDKGGAVLPDAKVTLTNLATNEMKVALSDNSGNYRFVQLLPGTYKVAVEKQGFQTSVVQPVAIRVGETANADASLQVGATTETIEVTTDTPLLSTQSSSLNYGVETKQVQELPLNGRNVLNLMGLVPGVVPQGNTSGNPATANVTGWGNYQIGGGTANQSAFYIDGAPINVSYVNATALIPTQEAIQEFQVATNNVSPEFGRFAGGVVNMATKSGSNQFHGTLYEYVRNAALNANLFFNKRNNLPRPKFTQHQYGTAVGGPVLKDKAFFYLSWEQFDLRRETLNNTTVPSAPMYTGNFSELLSLAKPLQLYDPTNLTCAGKRCPFVGNIIPAAKLDATAKVLGPLLFAPATATLSPAAGTNYTAITGQTTDYNQYMARGDEALGSRNKLFERVTLWHKNNAPGNVAMKNLMGTAGYFDTKQAVVGDTITISPNMVGDVRASFIRFINITMPLSCCDFKFSTLGPGWAQYQTQATFPQLPEPNITGMNNFNTIPTIKETDNAYVLSGSITAMLGRHTLQFGGEARKIEWMYVQSNSPGSTFNFDSNFSAASTGGAGGYGFASFMLGYPSAGFAQEPALSKGIMWYSGLFASDSFRWSPKLTLNAGVRWEQPGSFTESHGALTTMLLDLPQPALSAKAGRTITGGLGLINSPQYNKNNWQNLHWMAFSPRLGFAYTPSNQWVVRGGFGMSYLPPVVAFSLGPYNNPPNMATTTMTASLDGGVTPYNTLSNPYPGGISAPPGRSQAYIDSLIGQGIQSPLPNQPLAYSMQWNMGAQKQFGNTMVLNVGYVGSRGVHLPLYSVNMDQLPNQYLPMGDALTTKVNNPFYGIIPTSAGVLGQSTVGQGYLLKPYPQYLYMTADAPAVGDTAYEALQTMFQKRFVAGGVFTASYTMSDMKGTADVLSPWVEANRNGTGGAYGVQDNTNIKGNTTNPGEYSKSSFQLPNRLILNYVYSLPFGKGKQFFSGANGIVNGLIGNWTVNGITTFQDGFPIAFFDANPNALVTTFAAGNAGPGTGAGVSRPNVTAGCAKPVSGKPYDRLNKWFNTSCFSVPGKWEYGNEPRVDPDLRNQGLDTSDFSVLKDIPVGERYKLGLRVEFFNIFNWTQFAPPNSQADSTQFGKVTAQYNQPRLIQMSGRFTF